MKNDLQRKFIVVKWNENLISYNRLMKPKGCHFCNVYLITLRINKYYVMSHMGTKKNTKHKKNIWQSSWICVFYNTRIIAFESLPKVIAAIIIMFITTCIFAVIYF